MKKAFILAMACWASVAVSAQLIVNPNGNVAVKSEETPLSALSVNGEGLARGEMSVTSNGRDPVIVERSGTPENYDWGHAVEANNLVVPSIFNVGVRGNAHSIEGISGGRAYGVYGTAGNTSDGYNYGVFGSLLGTKKGAGIYGTCNINNGKYIGGRYAGYFDGNVHVNGELTTNTLVFNVRDDMDSIVIPPIIGGGDIFRPTSASKDEGEASIAEKLASLTVLQYQWKSSRTAASANAIEGDTASVETSALPLNSQAYTKKHYGISVDGLREAFPDLVYEDQEGNPCINYIEMIPLLVHCIGELKAEVARLETIASGKANMQKAPASTGMEESTAVVAALGQNEPNPFTENTEIAYVLPDNVRSAALYIYDMNGAQVDAFPITGGGAGTVTVEGGRLEAGMYLYSLIADGKVIDTKRMILTK